MNPIALQALERARAFPSAAPKPEPVAAPLTRRGPAVKPVPVSLTGKPERPKHFDYIGFIEGKRYATDTVLSMTGTLRMPDGVTRIINLLKSAASGRPVSQALGIWAVIELIEGAT